MDEELNSNTTVKEKITGGKAEITGMASQEEAQNLSDKINSGALPFSMETTNYNTISPTLGNKALNAMALAAEIALVLTCLFMIAWYRLPGVISCLTLAFQVALQVLVISVPQYTITLPGIAGLILSAGMAVDANIIINTRIKEEIAAGKSIESAIDIGFKKASSAVIDGNVTTFIAAIVLMILTSGTIKGFAQTLAIGTVLSIFTALVVSRFFVKTMYNMGLDKQSMYGVQKERKPFHIIEKRVISFAVIAVIIVVAVVGLFANKSGNINGRNKTLNYSIEFEGGINITANFDKKYTTDEFNDTILPVIQEISGDAEAIANEVGPARHRIWRWPC